MSKDCGHENSRVKTCVQQHLHPMHGLENVSTFGLFMFLGNLTRGTFGIVLVRGFHGTAKTFCLHRRLERCERSSFSGMKHFSQGNYGYLMTPLSSQLCVVCHLKAVYIYCLCLLWKGVRNFVLRVHNFPGIYTIN